MLLLETISVNSLAEFNKIIQAAKEGAISNSQKSIINLLQKRFGEQPEHFKETINKIDYISLLEKLILETISVNSVAEFQELIPRNFSKEN